MDDSTDQIGIPGFPVTVRMPIQWGDLDAYGHVNNLVYLKWFEAARAIYATRVGVEVVARDSGIGAIISQLLSIIMSLFSFLGGGGDDEPADPEVDEALDEVETILSDLIPAVGELDETMPNTEEMEDDEDDLMAA